uniref:Regulator of chromosome condensation (RCC1) repeat-containing protein n=1 Tax=Macrostomum lignano TaxID=282301 RepID=A0A1I8FJU2_9PLAT
SGAVFAFKNVPPKFYIPQRHSGGRGLRRRPRRGVTSSGRCSASDRTTTASWASAPQRQAKPSCVKKLREAGLHALRVACGPNAQPWAAAGFGFGNNSDGQLTGEATDLREPVELLYLDGKDIKDMRRWAVFQPDAQQAGRPVRLGLQRRGCLGQGAGLEESATRSSSLSCLNASWRWQRCLPRGLRAGQTARCTPWGESEGGNSACLAQRRRSILHASASSAARRQAARSVACGLQHTLVLTEPGRLLSLRNAATAVSSDSGPTGSTPAHDAGGSRRRCVSAGERQLACVSGRSGHLYAFGDALHGKLGPTSRRGQSNQYRPFRTEALARLRIQRAICGNTAHPATIRNWPPPKLTTRQRRTSPTTRWIRCRDEPATAVAHSGRQVGPGVEPDGSLASTLLVRRQHAFPHEVPRVRCPPVVRPTMTDSVDGGGLFANGGELSSCCGRGSDQVSEFEFGLPELARDKRRRRAGGQRRSRGRDCSGQVTGGPWSASPAFGCVGAAAAADTDGGSPRVAEETADTAAAAAAATADDGPIPQHVMAVTQQHFNMLTFLPNLRSVRQHLLQRRVTCRADTDEEAACPASRFKGPEKPLPKKRSEA